jgi:glycolate oxidase iron-sulfur subunit
MESMVTRSTVKISNFDSIHPPERKDIDDCVHCGFCLPACPTYVLWGDEMDSPRGRIYLIKKADDGQAAIDEVFRKHMDQCLGCMACMTACPSGVRYDRLIEPTRAQIERKLDRSWSDAFLRWVIFATLPYPSRLRKLLLPLRAYQSSGVQSLIRKSNLLRLLPRTVAAMEALLPNLRRRPTEPIASAAAAGGVARRRVAVLSGCIQEVFFSHVNAATIRVLRAEGCEVVVPPNQSCCGALMLHSGLNERGMAFAKKTIQTFENLDIDTIVINSAGCGSTMKEYGQLLKDDPRWADRARIISAKCKDISELLAELEPRTSRHALNMRIAYHDACHLRHAQKVQDQPRKLLGDVPGLEVAEIPESSLCCGSAGVYNLFHPETADQLAERKVENLLTTRAEAVVSANPGCLLQLMKEMRRRGMSPMPTFHMVELIDASIQGMSAEKLLGRPVQAESR